jgi:prepilin-type N-terminal cleavage/methylation domain-containing protein
MCKKTGFTLVELSMSLVLLATLLFLTGVQGRFLNQLLIRSELERLYSVCYYLQHYAMMSGESHQLTFDVENNRYTYCDTTHQMPRHVQFGTEQGVKGPPSTPNAVITAPITFKGNCIVFHPTGILQSGTVYLTNTQKQYTYALSCGVTQVSYVRKYQYNRKWELIS